MTDNNNLPDSREDLPQAGAYRTGSTCPPKSHRGVLAVLLVAIIFLGGVVTALSLLNIRLFRNVRKSGANDPSFRFSITETAPSEQQHTAFAPGNSDVQLQLQQAPQGVENIPVSGGLSLQEIYTKCIDSVVSITCTTPSGTSNGSGVVVSRDGYLVTNHHVIDGARQVAVLFNDGSKLPARVIGADALSDLAVLHVDASHLSAAEFGDDSSVRVGDSVVAIGDPLGIDLRGTMTNGIVSAINRNISTGGRTMNLIQTNAALNSGNSGGPLINCYGQVVGINTMKIGDNVSAAGVEGLGFAIPSTTVKEIVDQLLSQGYVSGRPSLGVSVQQMSTFDQLYYRVPQGLYITEVAQNTDAAAKGLVPGDILLSIDGQRLASIDTLRQLLYGHNAGDTVTAVIYRSGLQHQLEITLGEAN